MPTLWEIAEQLTALYWTLHERGDPSLERTLDVLFDSVAGLDILAGGITRPTVRRLLDSADEPS
jgi:hypothetical protein